AVAVVLADKLDFGDPMNGNIHHAKYSAQTMTAEQNVTITRNLKRSMRMSSMAHLARKLGSQRDCNVADQNAGPDCVRGFFLRLGQHFGFQRCAAGVTG